MRSVSKHAPRGAHYSALRRRCEIAQAWLYGNGWTAAASFALGLQRPPRARPVQMGFSPELTRPLRVAFASDLHAGPCTDMRVLEGAMDAIARFEPHVILLGGDFVSHHHRHVGRLVPLLARLQAACGIYAVPGNHDLWTDDRAIAAALESAGVRVLVNDNVLLPAPYDRVWVCGLDDPGTGSPDAARAFSGAAGARLLLMHSPLGLKHVLPDAFDLALCGHTHGGQVALPGGRPIVLPHGRHNRRYPHGLHELGGERNARLLVSKGVGCSDIPIRLFAAGEIHRITLFPQG